MDIVFLESPNMPTTARRFLRELFNSAKSMGIDCEILLRYRECKALVVYGVGGADRYPVAMKHLNSGKALLVFDLGYWERSLPNRKYRFSLNALHPSQVMEGKAPKPHRLREAGINVVSREINQKAPILLIGNAPKSIAIGAKNWAANKSREIRERFPNNEIAYRPKPKRPAENNVKYDLLSSEPIEKALKKVSLVVCRHSNVAIDACRYGVPVVCDDGAAAAIYPQDLKDFKQQPELQLRQEFLERLAYWQWAQYETTQFWAWFLKTFPEYDFR